MRLSFPLYMEWEEGVGTMKRSKEGCEMIAKQVRWPGDTNNLAGSEAYNDTTVDDVVLAIN